MDDKNEKQSENKLTTLFDSAVLVEKYATRIAGKEAASQFSTHLSIMAQKDERFRKAVPESLVSAMMACVHLGLMPNTPNQYAYLIPYARKDGRYEVQFQVGYKGLVELAYRTSQIVSINAELVFKGDNFRVTLGTDRQLVHSPNFNTDRTDYKDVTHAYMTAKLKNGSTVFEVMTRKELDKIQESAKAKSTDAPWATWPTEMAKKTVVKRGTKLLPSSGDDSRLQFAAAVDSWSEAGKLKVIDNGLVVEGEAVDNDAEVQKRMERAEAKRKEFLDNKDFKPKSVEVEND